MIEKAFAINAARNDIWDALWRDLGEGEDGRFEVRSSSFPQTFTLSMELAGVPVLLSYEIMPHDGFCEVSARLQPEGLRYLVYQVVTFGHFRRNYEMMLAQGLMNLKASLEEAEPQTDELEAGEPVD